MHVGRRISSLLALTGVVFAAPALSSAAAASAPHGPAQQPSAGSASAGDPYFPTQGNGGYDVAYYGLDIKYVPVTKLLSGTADIDATATKSLSRFNLDLRNNLRVQSVVVNGRAAGFAQPVSAPTELVITPGSALKQGRRFEVVVRYAGIAAPVIDPDGSTDGWVPTADGAVVASEPQGAPTWFPCNDTPADKATYDIAITVPAGRVAVSNGDFMGVRTSGGLSRWTWHERQPMSTYLVTATNGIYNVSTGRTPGGVPYFNAVAPSLAAASAPVLAKLPAMIDYFSSVYGRYPYSSAGAIVANLPSLGYALETQTRPLFSDVPDELTLAHELAHQWFGDGVTVTKWRDIWVAEGFAEFSSWLWSEHAGEETAQEFFDELYATPATETDFWNPPPANPGSGGEIFDTSVYERGALTLQALRVKLGDRTFFKVMRTWFAIGNGRNATPAEFAVLASVVSRRDLRNFFNVWLYQSGKPTSW
jgi:aminopeptidase N